jgi:hypothetical protein
MVLFFAFGLPRNQPVIVDGIRLGHHLGLTLINTDKDWATAIRLHELDPSFHPKKICLIASFHPCPTVSIDGLAGIRDAERTVLISYNPILVENATDSLCR